MADIKKTLKILKYRHIPKYIQKKYPLYVDFIEKFLEYLESYNSLEWYKGDSSLQEENSIYRNVANFEKFLLHEEFPIENDDFLRHYFNDHAPDLDFRNNFLSFSDDVLRGLIKNASVIHNFKDTWKIYNFIFSVVNTYFINNSENTLQYSCYFNDSTTLSSLVSLPSYYYSVEVSETDNFYYNQRVYVLDSGNYIYNGLVKYIDDNNDLIFFDDVQFEFSTGTVYDRDGNSITNITSVESSFSDYINTNEVVMSEIPAYYVSTELKNGTDVQILDIEDGSKGTRPFEYQIISKAPITRTGNFVSRLKKAANPAGYYLDIVIVVDELNLDTYIDNKNYPKYVIETSCKDDGMNNPVTKLTESGNNDYTNITKLETLSIVKKESRDSERARRVKKLIESGNL